MPPTTPPDLEVVLIAAVAADGTIGVDGELPWHYPADLAHFKETTMGSPVIAGRRTFEGILSRLGEPLPGRTNIVLSRSEPELPATVHLASDLETAFAQAANVSETVYIIGGETVYEATLPVADRLVLTEIPGTYDGDSFFPAWPPGDTWELVEERTADPLRFTTYRRSPAVEE